MRSSLANLLTRAALASFLLLTLGADVPAQEESPEKRGARRATRRAQEIPVLVEGQGEASEETGEVGPPRPADPGEQGPTPPPNVIQLPEGNGGGTRLDAGSPAQNDRNAPRPPRPARSLPFTGDRPLLEVNGVPIRSSEVNELVRYYNTFRPGSVDLLLRDSVSALISRAVVRAAYGEALPSMKERIDQAAAAIRGGTPFEQVVAEFSDDDEAPTEDGRYVFGREDAVQPFDRLSHSGQLNDLQGPFLTQYGYHLIEIVGYEQGLEAKDDQTTVRHVLVMFPFQGEDPRTEIRALLESCKIRMLEPGLRNLIDPRYRKNVLD